MAQPADGGRNDSSKTGREANGSKRTKRRTRSLLNLGIPFVQVDDFLNQSEDAVALGYAVLEETVKEIQLGFEQAKAFNKQQKAFEEGTAPAPTVPWEQLVERVQALQNIAFRTVRNGTDILFDSIKSSTGAVKSVAKTFEQSRDDLESKPRLAGPVFEDVLTVRVVAGQQLEPQKWHIRHHSLARLRINAVLAPGLKQLDKAHAKSDGPLATLKASSVSFAPRADNPEEISELIVDLGTVPENQPPGDYEGIVKASNFELLIARIRVTVDPPARNKNGGAAPGPKRGATGK